MSFAALDKKWQARWEKEGIYEVGEDPTRPKYYVLDMFPYPSGAGLHVGHPLGYIATDIIARYKRHQGYAVLHPMGFDSFGLPAEQYALRTGIPPALTTEKNIQRYTEQLKRIGLGYPWSRAVRTSDPKYYRWTQWIFLQLFSHWYDKKAQKARPISELEAIFAQEGNLRAEAATDFEDRFTAEEWNSWPERKRYEILLHYRLAYPQEALVNWCPALGTVLANEEVKDGLSERGGHPVYRVPMRQWFLRITAYADRLLDGLQELDWPEAIKEQQTHWIGRSEGAYIDFMAEAPTGEKVSLRVFSTRPDTLWGATFLVLAPEHPLVEKLTAPDKQSEVQAYQTQARNRTERDRLIGGGTPTGVFLGSYARHPYTQEKLPIYISDYVLMGYGTGAIMAVPAHDARDWAFAKHFSLPIRSIIAGISADEAPYEAKEGRLINSDFLTGLSVPEAIRTIRQKLSEDGNGAPTVQYRLRDVVFSRQRYWGEPFPIVWWDGLPYPLPEEELPVALPPIDKYEPTGDGRSPLTRLTEWIAHPSGGTRETDTMPGWAGSSWYFLRYADPHNDKALATPEKLHYWLPVDLYVGGAEHAVGHLLYARFWTHFLYDIGISPVKEPFRKLVNQGMILGRSMLIYKRKDAPVFVSADTIPPEEKANYLPVRVDISLTDDTRIDIEGFRRWMPEYAEATFLPNPQGAFHGEPLIEKMSKSFHNVVTPDELCERYGADAFRLYEMFLGPLTQTKPWDPRGIQGTYQFVRRLWRFLTGIDAVEPTQALFTDEEPSFEELHLLHATLKRVTEDIERLSLNTCVSHFMIFLNEMQQLSCRKKAIWRPFLVILEPFAPHIASELWERLGETQPIYTAPWPQPEEKYLAVAEIEYPISVNGKLRFHLRLPAEASPEEIETRVRQDERLPRYLNGKTIKRVVVVPGKIVNIVV
ncbi:MAG: leucine--tRNA ligase [Bacteroidia bacterium]|jgi:leucyl-tRNA synthetase|nr:leucine--tRNA ligase [Bacteroidia bacterium]GIV23122.1 MAG: leucine--tRNA ligase [Bacteroidia bacterium]